MNGKIEHNALRNFIKKYESKNTTFWVEDDYSFFKLIQNLESLKPLIKINFYEFTCVGFSYKNCVFKQHNLKEIDAKINKNTKYCYSYGSYALNILIDLVGKGLVTQTVMDAQIRNNLRESYVGGRNEFIQDPSIDSQLYSVDFHQMYFNCLTTRFLCGKLWKENTKEISNPGFYYIKYESDAMYYPVLYFKNVVNNQNYFCNGVGEGLFWYEEILLFLAEGGKIHKIYYAYFGEYYNHNFKEFTAYIATLGNKKITKNLANTLYGKLAMKDFFHPCELLTDNEFLLKNATSKIKKWNLWYSYYVCEKIDYVVYDKYTDISSAAALTAKARVRLHHLIKEIEQKGHICLLNTDEIIYTCKNQVEIQTPYATKTIKINHDEFSVKKNMFFQKRKQINQTTTTPFTLYDNMLI